MQRLSLEVKVGLLVTFTVGLVVAFLVFLGGYNPFSTTYTIKVVYNFAGGIEMGSPVRVSGVKVGKVDSIKFYEAGHKFESRDVSLALSLLIDRRVKHLIRKDSMFYINMAGIIGEKYIDILPGTEGYPELEDGDVVRGIDPPRIDQFISQGYDIFERLGNILTKITPEDREKMKVLLDNTLKITDNLAAISGEMRGNTGPLLKDIRILVADLKRSTAFLRPQTEAERRELEEKGEKLIDSVDHLVSVLERLDRLLTRLEDETSGLTKADIERIIREFFQQEGITINVGTISGKPKYPEPPPKSQE